RVDDPRIEVIEAPAPLSAGAARNLGREHAGDAGALLFLDADCALEPGGARLLHAELIERHLACVSARVLRDGCGIVARVRHALEFKEAEGRASPRPPHLPPSTTMLCRAVAFDRVGGFPDMWPGEDLVFMHRLRAGGMRAELSRLVQTRHRHPPGVGAMLAHQYRLGATAARARAMTGMHGAVFVRRRWLVPLLAPARLVRILAWYARTDPAQ